MKNPDIFLHFGNDVFNEAHKNEIKISRGIYIAYSGKYNGKNIVLNKLLYIGKADRQTFQERITDHIKNEYPSWKNECETDEDIYFRLAELDHDISDVEWAMIFTHKPPCNTAGVDKYLGDRPAPDVDYDIALEPVYGQLIDALDLDHKINKR